jgi:hypothetical protein
VHTDEEYRYDDGFLISRVAFDRAASPVVRAADEPNADHQPLSSALSASLGVDAAF